MSALGVVEAPPLDSLKSNGVGWLYKGSGCRVGSYHNMSLVLLSIPILASVIGAKASMGELTLWTIFPLPPI